MFLISSSVSRETSDFLRLYRAGSGYAARLCRGRAREDRAAVRRARPHHLRGLRGGLSRPTRARFAALSDRRGKPTERKPPYSQTAAATLR